jgi:WD40 repeat protein
MGPSLLLLVFALATGGAKDSESIGSATPSAPRVDRHGDPLPLGATARLGTVRLREVGSIAYAKDGKTLASGGGSLVRISDAETGKELRRFQGPDHYVESVALSSDGRWLAAGGVQVVYLWDLATGKLTHKLGVRGASLRVLFSPDSQALACRAGDGVVRLWNVGDGKEVFRRNTDRSSYEIAFTPDGKQILVGEFEVRFLDAGTGKVVRRLNVGRHHVQALAFTPDGSRLAVGGEKIIHLFDMPSGKELQPLSGPDEFAATSMAFSPDGKTLVAYCGDGTIRFWDVATRQERMRNQQRAVSNCMIAMAPHGKTLASISAENNVIRLWDTATGKERVPVAGHQGIVHSVAFIDNHHLVTGSHDGTVRLWDIRESKEVSRLLDLRQQEPESIQSGSPEIDTVAVSPDRRWIAAGGQYQTVHIFSADTNKPIRELKDCTGGGLAFSPDSSQLACSNQAGEVELRSIATGMILQSFKGQKYGSHALAFSPHGKLLASSTLLGRSITFWETATGKQVRKIDNLGSLYSLVFTLDGHWLIAEGRGNKLSLWDKTTGKEIPRFDGMHGYMVHALSPDGRTLAMSAFGGNDREIRLYEMATGQLRHRFQGHLSRVYGLAFSPDNRMLATAGEDTTVLLWDLTGRVALGPLSEALGEKELDQLWQELASDDAARAYRSVLSLAAAPEQAVRMLQQRLKAAVGVDNKVDPWSLSPDQLRKARALEVLERIGTVQARGVLAGLTRGAADGWLTQQSQASLQRLSTRINTH